MISSDRERQLQAEYHRDADVDHLAWQTEGPYFAETEARLLEGVRAEAGERLLEIGCGEGANLHHLGHLPGTRFGIDFSLEKSRAARATGARLACADATCLPFADGAFDVVLIRDLLHHVPARLDVLREAHRVLRPGGRFHLIEPNARAPLVVLQALTIRAERGLLRSTERRLRDELEASGFAGVGFAAAQPFPLARVLLHPRLGRPELGARPLVRAALDSLDTALTRVVPRAAWLYLCFSAVRP
jgi:SAM-dependent methyltransferase